jgi:ubiquinol-cytochrome c reductase cytochrome b subunit
LPETTSHDDVPGGVAGWLESRAGLVSLARAAFERPVPSVARFRYALGAALVASLIVEIFTGVLLMTIYSPSVEAAWASTFYIDRVLSMGWFIRGLHNFAAHAMIIVASLHLASVVVSGVYRAPREFNWWLGLGMLFVLVVFTLTGNALVWDQDGYWAWNVETGIAGGAPIVGPYIHRVVVGGTELGNATLGRLYALHVGVLPLVILLLLRGHVALGRRHALAHRGGSSVVEPAWPRQVFLNLLFTAVLLGTVSWMVVSDHGVSLEAPADPASQYPARPAWFFLWLFELRKSFPGPREVIATMVIPGALATVMVLLPFLDRVFPRKFAHFLACAFAFAVLGGAGYLSVKSLQTDAADAHYREAIVEADRARERAYVLASRGVPPGGAATLLATDPLYHGHRVFEQKCQGCHPYDKRRVGEGALAAPELKGFGTKEWVRELLENPDAPGYFGGMKRCDALLAGMANWKKGTGKDLTAEQLDQVSDFVASLAQIPSDTPVSVWENADAVQNDPGYAIFADQCASCHQWGEADEANFGPSLYAWGSKAWFRRMVLHPDAPDLYGAVKASCRMPAFATQLTENDVETVYRYLRGDYPSDAP